MRFMLRIPAAVFPLPGDIRRVKDLRQTFSGAEGFNGDISKCTRPCTWHQHATAVLLHDGFRRRCCSFASFSALLAQLASRSALPSRSAHTYGPIRFMLRFPPGQWVSTAACGFFYTTPRCLVLQGIPAWSQVSPGRSASPRRSTWISPDVRKGPAHGSAPHVLCNLAFCCCAVPPSCPHPPAATDASVASKCGTTRHPALCRVCPAHTKPLPPNPTTALAQGTSPESDSPSTPSTTRPRSRTAPRASSRTPPPGPATT